MGHEKKELLVENGVHFIMKYELEKDFTIMSTRFGNIDSHNLFHTSQEAMAAMSKE